MEYPLPNLSIDLSGEVALVTGASSGLGYRFAKVLAAAGAAVAVTGRRKDRLEAVAAEIEKAGGRAAAIVLDVTSAEALAAAVSQAEAELGLVTILVNNAGVADGQLATKMTADLVDLVLDTNVRAPFLLSSHVAARLIKARRPGRIVNISSMAAFTAPTQGASLYSISKAAVVRLTETLAVEWSTQRINVNCIAPGSFDSEMMDGLRTRIGDEFIDSFPRKRLCDPALLDSTLLYLVSPASEAVTGAILKVDDGQFPR